MTDSFDRADALHRILRAILERPTAPFHEHAVLEAIDGFARAHAPCVRLAADASGNRILEVRGTRASRGAPALAFTAHLDHPGLVRDPGARRFELLGRVTPAARLRGGRVRFFDAAATPAGRGRVLRVEEEAGRIWTEVRGAEPGAAFAMFDFPALRIRGDRITGRVCDDLLGAIAILAAVEECLATDPRASFLAVFTRAEEVGFVGALQMLKDGAIPRGVPMVGLECSAARGGNAVIGAGPIVRVGDFSTTFDPGVTAFLRDCADSIAAEDPEFRYQRRLMQGGSCESTAFLLDGRPAGALCLALGNYHNVPDRGPADPSTGLAAEHVSMRDLDGLVRLLVRAVRDARSLGDPFRATRERLEERRRRLAPRLR